MLVGQIWAKLLLPQVDLTGLTYAGLPKSLCLAAKSNALCKERLLIVFPYNQYGKWGQVNVAVGSV